MRLRRLFRDGSFLFAGGLTVAALSLAQSVVLARGLGVAHYGTWGVALAFAGVTRSVLGFRTQEPLTRYLVEFRQRADRAAVELLLGTALRTELATRALACSVVVLAAPWAAARLAGGAEALPVYWILGIGGMAGFVEAVWFSVSRDRKRFAILSAIPAATAAARLLGIAALWVADRLDLLTLVLVYVGTLAVQSLAQWADLTRILRRDYGIAWRALVSRRHRSRRGELSGFWTFMRATWASSVLSTLVKGGDVLLLGYFRGEAEVGVYRVAKQAASTLKAAAGSLARVIYQDFNELVAASAWDRLRASIARLMRAWAPMVAAALALAMALAGVVIVAVYGAEYADAVAPFRILVGGMGVAMLLFWVQPLGLALDRAGTFLRLTAVLNVVALAAIAALSFHLGARGAALGVAGAWVLLSVGMLGVVVRAWRHVPAGRVAAEAGRDG